MVGYRVSWLLGTGALIFTVTASLHILVRGALGTQDDPIRVTFGITDQFGTEYTLKKILMRTPDPKLPNPSGRETQNRISN